jgi:hypothetical protein
MINILDFTSFINEAENVYSGGGDPYSIMTNSPKRLRDKINSTR